MGFFSKLFGSSEGREQAGGADAGTHDPGAASPTTVTDLEGRPVISVEDTFMITGRGLTVTGPLQQNVQVGDRCQVQHQGRREVLRVGGIQLGGTTVNQAATGSGVGLLVVRDSRH